MRLRTLRESRVRITKQTNQSNTEQGSEPYFLPCHEIKKRTLTCCSLWCFWSVWSWASPTSRSWLVNCSVRAILIQNMNQCQLNWVYWNIIQCKLENIDLGSRYKQFKVPKRFISKSTVKVSLSWKYEITTQDAHGILSFARYFQNTSSHFVWSNYGVYASRACLCCPCTIITAFFAIVRLQGLI